MFITGCIITVCKFYIYGLSVLCRSVCVICNYTICIRKNLYVGVFFIANPCLKAYPCNWLSVCSHNSCTESSALTSIIYFCRLYYQILHSLFQGSYLCIYLCLCRIIIINILCCTNCCLQGFESALIILCIQCLCILKRFF